MPDSERRSAEQELRELLLGIPALPESRLFQIVGRELLREQNMMVPYESTRETAFTSANLTSHLTPEWLADRGLESSRDPRYMRIDRERMWVRRDDPRFQVCQNCSTSFRVGSRSRRERNEGRWFCSDHCATAAGIQNPRLMSYSESNYKMEEVTESQPWLIGFEVEKEDSDWYENDLIGYTSQWDWIAVSDGSLECYGFELVSPAYNLSNIKEIKETISAIEAIDADCSSNCGGHITVSERGLSGTDLIRKIDDFVPLMLALYPKRILSSWTAIQKKQYQHDTGEKYRAFNVKSRCVEVRLFPRVKNRRQLIWRTELLAWALDVANRKSIPDELHSNDSWLVDHLKEVYRRNQSERIDRKRKLHDAFNSWYDTTYDHELNSDTKRALSPYIRSLR